MKAQVLRRYGKKRALELADMTYKFDFTGVLAQWPLFLHGAWLTIKLSLAATLLGLLIGTLCAIGRGSRNRFVARACAIYVEAIRNTPLLVQIFLVYFGLASIGLKVPAFAAAVLAMVINVGAYTTEIMQEKAPQRQLEQKFVLRVNDLGIGVRKDDPKLLAWINDWVKANHANGKLNEIFKKYHGSEIPKDVVEKWVK